jgi:NADH:ubiquinone oxidoreductase subunit C
MKNYSLLVLSNYRTYLKKMFPQSFTYILNGELFIKIAFFDLKKVITFLNLHTQSQYKILSDICATDFPWKKNRFELFYNLLSITFNSRITIITSLKEQDSIESLQDIYKVASWFERELWDMFGIFFSNNTDLRRILTDYGFKGHPLRKDFPLTGFIEVRYFHIEKRILVEEVSLTQDYRTFYFNNTWSKNI